MVAGTTVGVTVMAGAFTVSTVAAEACTAEGAELSVAESPSVEQPLSIRVVSKIAKNVFTVCYLVDRFHGVTLTLSTARVQT
jgi:hypothetical protein